MYYINYVDFVIWHVTKYFYEGNTVHVIYVPCISVMTLQ